MVWRRLGLILLTRSTTAVRGFSKVNLMEPALAPAVGQCSGCWRQKSQAFRGERQRADPCLRSRSRCQKFGIVPATILAVTLRQRPSVPSSHHRVGEKILSFLFCLTGTSLPRHSALWECSRRQTMSHMVPKTFLQTREVDVGRLNAMVAPPPLTCSHGGRLSGGRSKFTWENAFGDVTKGSDTAPPAKCWLHSFICHLSPTWKLQIFGG